MTRNLFLGVHLAPYRLDLCNSLFERYGFEIFHYEEDEDLGFDPRKLAEGIRFTDRRYARPRFDRKSYLALKRLVGRYRPEVVLTSEFSVTTLLMLILRRRWHFRLVSVCDDSLDMIRGNDFSLRHRMARRWVPRWLDNLLLPSDEAVQWYQTHFGKGVCMPIIADDRRLRETYLSALPMAESLADQYGVRGMPVVLFVGRLIPLKNVDLLIRAFAREHFPARLMIVGSGPSREEWEALARTLDVPAVFTGSLSGMPLAAVYQLADILVLPSRQEAFGAVVNEALVAGASVIVSERAGARTLVDPSNGRVVPPTLEAIAAALRESLDGITPRSSYSMRPDRIPFTFADKLSEAFSQL